MDELDWLRRENRLMKAALERYLDESEWFTFKREYRGIKEYDGKTVNQMRLIAHEVLNEISSNKEQRSKVSAE